MQEYCPVVADEIELEPEPEPEPAPEPRPAMSAYAEHQIAQAMERAANIPEGDPDQIPAEPEHGSAPAATCPKPPKDD